MQKKDLERIFAGFLYGYSLDYALEEYNDYFQDIKPFFPVEFQNHYSQYGPYNGWLLKKILYFNTFTPKSFPNITLVLSKDEAIIKLTFTGLSCCTIKEDVMDAKQESTNKTVVGMHFARGVSVIDHTANTKQLSMHCIFSSGMIVAIDYEEMTLTCETTLTGS